MLIDYVLGNDTTIKNMQNIPVLKAFDDRVVEFLHSLANELLKKSKQYPDVVAFAFFCSKTNILKYKKDYDGLVGRGIAFHSTPSNIPTNFAYSLISSLLAGNKTIMRLPLKGFDETKIIVECIKNLIQKEFHFLKDYIVLAKFKGDLEILNYFSSISDVRVIWGGDENVKKIKSSKAKIRNIDLVFSDRNSFCVIDGYEFLNYENKNKIINDFYNDTYLVDQNACSSPKAVFWLNDKDDSAKNIFWNMLEEKIQNYNLSPAKSVAKLHTFMKIVSNHKQTKFIKSKNNILLRVSTNDNILNMIEDVKINSGFFIEQDIEDICDLLQISDDKTQSLMYFGISTETMQKLINHNPKIDRIVPIGKAMEFNFVWDGYDIIKTMSRKIIFKEQV